MGGKKKHTAGLGRAIALSQKKIFDENRKFHSSGHNLLLEGAQHGTSCLEASNLTDFLSRAELANQEFEMIRGKVTLEDMRVVGGTGLRREGMTSDEAERRGLVVPIPRRPFWTADTDPEELEKAEHLNFLNWRKALSKLEEGHGYLMTPFERNIDFWRQLWRVVEKSDVVVQILDCRDPLFFRCLDLEKLVSSYGEDKRHLENPLLLAKKKRNILILNKADLMDLETRQQWRKYFSGELNKTVNGAKTNASIRGGEIEVVFFSAVRELQRLDILTTETKVTGLLYDRAELSDVGEGAGESDESESDAAEEGRNGTNQVEGSESASNMKPEDSASNCNDTVVPALIKPFIPTKEQRAHANGLRAEELFSKTQAQKNLKDHQAEKALHTANALMRHETRRRHGAMTEAKSNKKDLLEASTSKSNNDGTVEEVFQAPKRKACGFAALGVDSESDSDTQEGSENSSPEEESGSEARNDNDEDSTPETDSEELVVPGPSSEESAIEEVVSGESTDPRDKVLNCDELMEFLLHQTNALLGESEHSEEPRKPVVGFVGYPNVGKSSIINALFGSKKVSMSRQPGKTKHFQTLESPLFTLCDCPGLVFPSLVATKAHLVINSTMPIDQTIGQRSEERVIAPVKLIAEKLGTKKLYEFYGIKSNQILAMRGCQVSRFLHSFAASRGKFLRDKVPDEMWASRSVLRDFTTGKLVYCELPPSLINAKAENAGNTAVQDLKHLVDIPEEECLGAPKERLLTDSDSEEEVLTPEAQARKLAQIKLEDQRYESKPATTMDIADFDEFDELDFDDISNFMNNRGVKPPQMTKRALRRQAKLEQKYGGGGTNAGSKSTNSSSAKPTGKREVATLRGYEYGAK